MCSNGPPSHRGLFVEHSFFKPFANNMVSLRVQWIGGKIDGTCISGGQNGAPQAMWEDDRNRNKSRLLRWWQCELFV